MKDTLERERLVDNLIDQVFRLQERVARLEELLLGIKETDVIVPEPDVDGRWRLYVQDLGGEIGPVLVMVEVF